MKTNYIFLRQLLELFESFEQTGENVDVLDFAHWIINKYDDTMELDKPTISKKDRYIRPEVLPALKEMKPESRFLETISRIARYHDFYVKKALQEMDINTRFEFLFLQTLGKLGQAKKTDLINMHLLEYTTGMDTILRMIKNGLLFEKQSVDDKRVKLLLLTEKGTEILKRTEKRIKEENEMFLLSFNLNKWKKTMPLLEDLDMFHHKIYQLHGNKPFAEISNLMDSLKHLHK